MRSGPPVVQMIEEWLHANLTPDDRPSPTAVAKATGFTISQVETAFAGLKRRGRWVWQRLTVAEAARLANEAWRARAGSIQNAAWDWLVANVAEGERPDPTQCAEALGVKRKHVLTAWRDARVSGRQWVWGAAVPLTVDRSGNTFERVVDPTPEEIAERCAEIRKQRRVAC